MKSVRRSTLVQGSLFAAALLGLSYWVWQRYHPPAVPTYEGQTLEQWIRDLGDPGDIDLNRRAAAALVRIGAPAAPRLAAEMANNPKDQRIEVPLVRLGTAAVPTLRDALQDENDAEAAAHVLALMGPPAADAVPDLIVLLQRRQAGGAAREAAAFALGRIGVPSAEIVPPLIEALSDRKVELRRQAADALGWIGPEAREATPALLAALKDEDAATVKIACQALSFIAEERAVAPLVELFQSERAETKLEAGRALWRLGAKAESIWPALLALAQGPLDKTGPARDLLASFGPLAVPLLTKALGDNEAARREAAADILGRIGPPARPAVPSLLAALKDKTSSVSLISALALAQIDPTRAGPAVPLLADALDTPAAAHALAYIGADARAAVPDLIAVLKPPKDTTGETRVRAAQLALARIGKPAVPALIEALKDKKKDAAPLAAETLGWILPPPKEAIPALRQALADDRAHGGVYARALGRLGPLAREALPDVAKLLDDAEQRGEAALALVKIDPAQADKVVPLLVKDFRAGDEKQRQRTADALARMGAAAQAAAPALVEALHDPAATQAVLHALQGIGASSLAQELKDANVEYRRAAVKLLAQLGPAAKPALPAVLAALHDADATVRVGAALVVEGIGTDAADAVPALTANLQAPQAVLRAQSASALANMGSTATEARRQLMGCLFDPDENVRRYAALALGRMQPPFREAVPILRQAANDPSPPVRLTVLDALSHLDRERVADYLPILGDLSRKPYPLDIRLPAVEGLHDLGAAERAKQSEPWLRSELSDIDPLNCLYAARVLARIDPSQAPSVVLALAAALRTPHPEARRYILHTLGEFEAKARAALPEIEFLLQDSGPGMREEAIKALRAIQPGRLKQLGID
jgi:HEAT repeat protein